MNPLTEREKMLGYIASLATLGLYNVGKKPGDTKKYDEQFMHMINELRRTECPGVPETEMYELCHIWADENTRLNKISHMMGWDDFGEVSL